MIHLYNLDARESNHSVNQPVLPRVASPPVPALMKRMGTALPIPPLNASQVQPILDKDIEKTGNVTNIYYPPTVTDNGATSSDTQAILEQLAAIQRVFYIIFELL